MTTRPRALEHVDEIARRLGAGLVSLDYDGTLTPIVSRPEAADLSPRARAVLRRVSRRRPVAVVSGRDLRDVQRRVGLARLAYAGSHGWEIAGPGGLEHVHPAGLAALPLLDAAERELAAAVAGIDGAQVERKRFSIAVHTRNVARDRVPEIQAAVAGTLRGRAGLVATGGKEVLELRPAADWHKGRAVRWLAETLGPFPGVLHVGDDTTDEDVFRALGDDGIGVHVGQGAGTAAGFVVADPGEVLALLEALAAR